MVNVQTYPASRVHSAQPSAADNGITPIGKILRDYRREVGLTQAALARRSGLSTSLISKIEVSLRAVNSETVTKLAPVLGLSDISEERLMQLIDPHLRTIAQRPMALTRRELSMLDSTSYPACYLKPGLYVVSAANEAFARVFPGLRVGDNLVEWHLFSPWAKAVLPEWETEAHLWVRACREALTGFIPNSELEAVKTRLRRCPNFDTMWNTRAPESLATRELLRLRDPASKTSNPREMFTHLSRDERHFALTPNVSSPHDPNASQSHVAPTGGVSSGRCSCEGSARRRTIADDGVQPLAPAR
ncbi:helix-turn-helix domain-containing protein [Nocardia sp. NPDC049220]|uniref:helix-turn-helix domain-containing protein n=1 Tax=Nocardia sp. NPDC049220 TaxID=3155273 RepID=UPI0033E0C2DB